MLDESSWLAWRPPSWLRWVIAFGVAGALAAGLIAWVSHHNGNGLATESPKAEERANREAAIVVEQDQAPHVATVTSAGGAAAVTHAIRRAMTVRIAKGQAVAPLQHVRCAATGSRAGTTGYRCTAISAGVAYPYEAVLAHRTRRLTYCKHDAPPEPSMNIPVSPRCRL